MLHLNTIYNMDCLEGMKYIPDNCIDLIVTDPPYLMNYKSGRRKDKAHDFCTPIQNDNNEQVISDAIKQMYRVLKNNSAMYIFCNSNKVDFFKQQLEKTGFTIKNMIIWKKNNHTAGDLQAQFGKQYEIIFLANKGRCIFNGKRITDIWEFDKVVGKNQLHQNQKPIDLLTRCIEYHSKENDVVLDCFMGSGSTAIACINTKRNYIGFEIDKNYHDIANERIKANGI